jgi:hypothetical protein
MARICEIGSLWVSFIKTLGSNKNLVIKPTSYPYITCAKKMVGWQLKILENNMAVKLKKNLKICGNFVGLDLNKINHTNQI